MPSILRGRTDYDIDDSRMRDKDKLPNFVIVTFDFDESGTKIELGLDTSNCRSKEQILNLAMRKLASFDRMHVKYCEDREI